VSNGSLDVLAALSNLTALFRSQFADLTYNFLHKTPAPVPGYRWETWSRY
jgi:hypothetical protein